MKKVLALMIIPMLALASCGSSPAIPDPNNMPHTNTNTEQQDTGSQSMSKEEAQILQEVNAIRAKGYRCGNTNMAPAAPVTWNGYLAEAARGHARDMATRNFFDHTNPDGQDVAHRVQAAGYTNWREVGENIAAGFTASNVVQGWLESNSHCTTLMDPALKEMGVGYIYRSSSTYGTYWVQNFGAR